MEQSSLLTQEQLAHWCGFQRKCDIEHWLRKNHIQFFKGRKETICTTLNAINSSLYEDTHDDIEFL